jgi:hypothetical protein
VTFRAGGGCYDALRVCWTPEHVNHPHVPDEGNAHLYVNGKKLARLWGGWYHLEHLRPGDNRVAVPGK